MEIFVGFRNAKYADVCFLSDTPAYGYAAPEFLSSGEPPNLLVFCPFVAVNCLFGKERKEVINLVCTIVHDCKKIRIFVIYESCNYHNYATFAIE